MESTTSIQTTTEPRPTPGGVAKLIRKVRKVTKRRFTADQKIKIVLEGFRKEIPVTELCHREKVSAAIYYKWLKEFMEGGKDSLLYLILNEKIGAGFHRPPFFYVSNLVPNLCHFITKTHGNRQNSQ